ncbi:hypothetical protein LBMAG42_38470 [Deltaproteobacteria bacterium]|nr:hypothetical protein LBMAG42_38470 [Deltaproteobacteria bacterium]
MNTWLELHVDDEVLTRDPGAWPEAAALLDGVATAAESAGGRLSFRIRTKFAAADRFGFLLSLQRRGHEVGAHAHGRDLASAVAALRATGILPTVMAPGLVQVGAAGETKLLDLARSLGALGITDRLEARRWTYQGWLPRRHPNGLWMLDVSVSPFDWGVLRRAGGGAPRAAFGSLDWAALDRCASVQASQAVPAGWAPFFGATFHEHDLCAERQLTPADPTFDGLRRWVERWTPRPSAEAAAGRTLDGAGQVERTAAWAGGRNALPLALRSRISRVRARNEIPSNDLPPHRVVRAPRPRVSIVAVHAGDGGLVERLRFLGLADNAGAPDANLWLYARREAGWAAPGNPSHVADARQVLDAALGEGLPVVLLSWSGGGVSAARALIDLGRDAPALSARVCAWIDVEGPCDRHSLQKPGAEAEWAALSPHDDTVWRGRELVSLFPALARLPSPPAYHRWQGSPDHVHQGCVLHAERALAAARSAGLRTTLTQVAGPLREHGSVWRHALSDVLNVAAVATSSAGSLPVVEPGGARRPAPAR